MDSTTQQLQKAALALPEEDRVELIDALIVSLETADQPPFDESWHEIIRRRSAELRSGAVVPVPWAKIKSPVK